ncbi:Hypothetical predicted protein [Mytilus galloprovincialis]|uniref:EF-hand domain-containing protein n=1 Tax=Mytilus galloprovincialis TaxID=29158 RepID=A0A8B6FVD1_MYTGA|nr:Hypothetical predicted protein [Mytilus galloprovincialis]
MALDWLFVGLTLANDGHINADEFSTFYANANIPGLTYSKSQWTQMFNQAMTVIDTNGNNELEMGEINRNINLESMKSLIVLCCFVSVSLAFPGMFSALTRRDSTPSVAEAIQKTTSMVNKRTVEKRMSDGVGLAFRWIDSNHNVHINADEFSTFMQMLISLA